MSSSHHTEQKTFIEASCTNNIHTREFFLQLQLLEVSKSFLFRQSKKLVVYFGMYESSLIFQRREDQINTVCKK